jgi:hypothetical protein
MLLPLGLTFYVCSWFSEIVLAEYLAKRFKASIVDPDIAGPTRRKSVLELGCGVAPASGMLAFALGYDVVFTDMSAVLPALRRNFEINAQILLESRGQGEVSKDSGVLQS